MLNKGVNFNSCISASEMTYIVSSGALNSTHSPTRLSIYGTVVFSDRDCL